MEAGERTYLKPARPMHGVEGLQYSEQFVTVREERTLLSKLDEAPWSTTLKRRTQQYGYEYLYSRAGLRSAPPIPAWCDFLVDRIVEYGLMAHRPDQMIVNEYLPGEGIAAHVDDPRLFADGIVSVSLGSRCVMLFSRGRTEKVELPLECLSAVALHGPARYEWTHAIPKRKSDAGCVRERRVSLTFRNLSGKAGKGEKKEKSEKGENTGNPEKRTRVDIAEEV